VAVKVDSTTITGALSDINTLYDANTAGTVTNLGNEVVTISDSGSVSAADLHAVNTLTNGVVSANAVSVVTGSVVDLLKVYSSGNTAGVIAGLGNESIIITDTGTVAASDITTLDGLTSGSITATSVTKLTGSVTEISAARSGATVTGVTSLALTGSTETFDATSYLASNADLIKAFGNSPSSAITHYLAFGVNESRNLDSFDEKSYLASHADLLTAFGSDVTKATAHYISNGFSENRSVDTFDELGYVASYKDLITALGDDANAAVDHYINFGFGENRTSTFDASSYLSANADLSAAFGSDLELAKKHYINHGVNENRALA
jgi:serralysin